MFKWALNSDVKVKIGSWIGPSTMIGTRVLNISASILQMLFHVLTLKSAEPASISSMIWTLYGLLVKSAFSNVARV